MTETRFLKIGILAIGAYLVFGAWKLVFITLPNKLGHELILRMIKERGR